MASQPTAPAARPRAATEPVVAPGARALYSIATSLDAGTDPQAILLELLRRTAAAAAARRAWLLTGSGEAGRPAAAWPDPADGLPPPDQPEVITVPLPHDGVTVATLVLALPADGAFSPAARRLVSALARPAAAVAAVALRLDAEQQRAARAAEAAALLAEVAAAVDHDLRTPLTTVLGALQTLARPEYAPADADLAALLSSALAQAERMRMLLGDLLLASAPASRGEALSPEGIRSLVVEAVRSGMGEGAAVPIEIPRQLPPARVPGPALRRILAGVLRRACRRSLAARVEVAAWGEDLLVAVNADGPGPLAPDLSARLAAAIGARLEESSGADGTAVVLLVLPGALGPDAAAVSP